MLRRNVIVIGATSAIATQYLYRRGALLGRVALCGRNVEALEVLRLDLVARVPGLIAEIFHADMTNMLEAEIVFEKLGKFIGKVDEIVVAPGLLVDQSIAANDMSKATDILMVNSVGPTIWCMMASNLLARQGSGVLCVVSSVAGVRGRASNYLYGSAKAQLSVLVEGLQCRFAGTKVKVIDFRPGMVSTPMTAGMKQGVLMASAKKVGCDMAKAIDHSNGVVYSPGFWRPIMLVIRHLPFAIFSKLKI